jgi:hypothetical protein
VLTDLSDEPLVLALLAPGVFVHPGFFFGVTNGCYIVISALVAPPQLTIGLQRLVAGLRQLCGDVVTPVKRAVLTTKKDAIQ